jgi:uncharacterized protein
MPDETASQERVFQTLGRNPGVKRIDTHGASVFLDGDRALKVKRAVRFPFLDYATLEKRKAACEEEIRINRPIAPQIYHRVVAITEEPDGSISVGGTGRPIEYAVEMSRFDENRTLDHLTKGGPLDGDVAAATADAILASHDAAIPADGEAWVASIPALIDGVCHGLLVGTHLEAAMVSDLCEDIRQALLRLDPLLRERARRGFVRRCHGDLHLANIVMIDGQPVLFDAIEFDAQIATVDVLYDLAFPLMDLLRHDQPVAANIMLNRYLGKAVADHLDGLSTLPLFMAIRAAIRAEVALARLQRPHADGPAIIDEACHYLSLARTLIHPPSPSLIVVGGLSGTGKSVLARTLAPTVPPQPGAVLLRSDVVRKQMFGMCETERLPPSAYTPELAAQVYDVLIRNAQRVLAQGHSVVVDGVFAREAEREAFAALAKACRVSLAGLFLTADLPTRLARIGSRRDDASDATQEVAALQEHYKIGHVGWATIDASGTPAQTLERCRNAIVGTDKAV